MAVDSIILIEQGTSATTEDERLLWIERWLLNQAGGGDEDALEQLLLWTALCITAIVVLSFLCCAGPYCACCEKKEKND